MDKKPPTPCPDCGSRKTDEGYSSLYRNGYSIFECNECGYRVENNVVTRFGLKEPVVHFHNCLLKLEECLHEVLAELPHGDGICQCDLCDREPIFLVRREFNEQMFDSPEVEKYCLRCGGLIDD